MIIRKGCRKHVKYGDKLKEAWKEMNCQQKFKKRQKEVYKSTCFIYLFRLFIPISLQGGSKDNKKKNAPIWRLPLKPVSRGIRPLLPHTPYSIFRMIWQ